MEVILIPLRTNNRPGRLHVADHPVAQLVLVPGHAVGEGDRLHPITEIFVELADKADDFAIVEGHDDVVACPGHRHLR